MGRSSIDGGRTRAGRQTGLYGSWPQIGVTSRITAIDRRVSIVSNLTGRPTARLGLARCRFLLSIILLAWDYSSRLRIHETPAFSQVKETGQEARIPLFEAIRAILGISPRYGARLAREWLLLCLQRFCARLRH